LFHPRRAKPARLGHPGLPGPPINEFREETVLRIGNTDSLDEVKLEQQLNDAQQKLLKDGKQIPESKRSALVKRTGKRR
jgi:hypothetical protein